MADPRHPRHCDEAFKRQIVQLYESGKPSREIRAEYDIARSAPRRWVQGIPRRSAWIRSPATCAPSGATAANATGARKIKAALERRGVTASRRRIGNIMREQGMTSAYARRRFKPHKTRADEARLANLLDRGSDGYAPHTHLAGGLTYVRVGGGRAYVCLLVDLANRGIAGHSVGRTRDASLVLGAFATLDFPLTDVQVFHTDRGSEFDNTRIDELLDVFGIKRSLSRKGNPYDNAVVESTNRLLKKELIYRNQYATIEQLRRDLNDYVWWSDDQRLHSTLGYRSPKEFTEQGLVL